jgi:hypothetical protein
MIRKGTFTLEQLLDSIANILAIEELRRNRQPIKLSSLPSLCLLFAPGVFFLVSLYLLKDLHPKFAWFNHIMHYPWQFWAIGAFGSIATLGGAGDWLFHKVYVTVGPNEHHSHLLALATGGGVFLLMGIASVVEHPLTFLIPVIITLLTTAALICYDEFAFHIHRCKPFETILHRMLVFGNGATLLCWMHWTFVAGSSYA